MWARRTVRIDPNANSEEEPPKPQQISSLQRRATLTSVPWHHSGGAFQIAFDPAGNVRWVVPNETPQIATADGGVIGQSGTTSDQYGNATRANSPGDAIVERLGLLERRLSYFGLHPSSPA